MAEAAPAPPAHSRSWIHVALILLAVTVVYSGSFDGDYLSDDLLAVRDNPLLEELSWQNVKAIFSTFDDTNYIPLKVLSLAVDRALFGHRVQGYHAMNLVYHIACALLLYLVLCRLKFAGWAACLAALAWALHPLQVESVAWISERKNVLSTLFLLGAFAAWMAYSRSLRGRTLIWVFVLYAAALLSKMNTMVLPALCLAYEWTYGRRTLRHAWPLLPMLALGALAGWYAITYSPLSHDYHGGSAWVTWLTSGTVVFRYLGLTLLPLDLSPAYSVRLKDSLLDPAVAASFVGLLLLAAGTIVLLRRGKRAGFWSAWFFVSLSPMLNIIPFPALMHDRYLYVPLVGAAGLAAVAIGGLGSRGRRVAAGVVVVVIALLGVLSHTQVEAWRDATSHQLWLETRMALPFSDRAHPGAEPAERYRRLEAQLEKRGGSAIILNNLARRRYNQGDYQGAWRLIHEARKQDPALPEVGFNYGRLALLGGRLDDAIEALESYREADPYYLYTHLNLARAHLLKGDAEAADAALDACDRIRPGSVSYWRPERHRQAELEAQRAGD